MRLATEKRAKNSHGPRRQNSRGTEIEIAQHRLHGAVVRHSNNQPPPESRNAPPNLTVWAKKESRAPRHAFPPSAHKTWFGRGWGETYIPLRHRVGISTNKTPVTKKKKPLVFLFFLYYLLPVHVAGGAKRESEHGHADETTPRAESNQNPLGNPPPPLFPPFPPRRS